MIPIPETLIIGDITWRIIRRSRLGKGVLGMCDDAEHIIYIRTRLSEHDLLSTLIHEVLHAIEYTTQTPLPHKSIYLIEAPLASVFKQLLDCNTKP